MLEEREFRKIWAMLAVADQASLNIPHGQDPAVDKLLEPILDAYADLTGVRISDLAGIMHHRLSLFGPPCKGCGKLLRTAKAAKCFMCGKAK